MRHADVAGLSLHYLRRGEGEPLLLIQGMSGTHLSWGEPFEAALAGAGLELITYDHRGAGHSAPVAGGFSIAQLADDAAGLLDALELERAHVLGISMGGMVAQELALRHPQRLRTLTLGCTYCGGPGARLAGEEVATGLGQALLSGDRERALRAGYEFNLSRAFTAEPANYDPFRTMATTLPVPVPVIMLQMQAIRGHDTSTRLPRLEVPTLVIHGTEDRMLPFANGELIARLVPGARLERLDGVGHMFWWEQPERSAWLVAEHALGARAAAPARGDL
jgi:pimeloyl-ACP methyl ester carboxylesterase